MLITIENFGAIKYFQFDTEKDMYLLFGKNSVGKSYAISLVYLILKNINRLKEYPFMNENDFILPNILSDFHNHKAYVYFQESFDVSKDIDNNIKNLLNKYFVNALNKSINNTFGNITELQNNLSNGKLTLKIQWKTTEPEIVIGLSQHNHSTLSVITSNLKQKVFFKESKEYVESKNNDDIIIGFNPYDYFGNRINFMMFIRKLMLSKFPNEFEGEIYYFPASRSGLYLALSSFGQIFAQISSNRDIVSEPFQLAAIPEPISDYFLHLSDKNITEKNNDDFYISYVNEIEQEILSGVVSFDKDTKRLLFKPHQLDRYLDLSIVSSMESEVFPIVFYLKYILPVSDNSLKLYKKTDSEDINEDKVNNGLRLSFQRKKPLIFIEEPEAHLHPETQVKLMEVFARMVKDNKIKLVMTSHSNYIFNKASNLVIDNKIDKDKFKAVLFDMTGEGSIARELETDEYGIEDENFIDTAESIYEERIALTNKLNG